MKYYIEAWSARQLWLDLAQKERGAYMAQLAPAIQQLIDQGVEIISWGANDADTDKRLNYDFFAIWKFPSDEVAKGFEAMVGAAGWHNYFEQQNLKGDPASPQDIIGKLISM